MDSPVQSAGYQITVSPRTSNTRYASYACVDGLAKSHSTIPAARANIVRSLNVHTNVGYRQHAGAWRKALTSAA